jgi:uncharacterized protein
MLFTAFVLGFAGSLHCLGMCSPLVIAVTPVRAPFLLNRVINNAGRILTYGILGASTKGLGYLLPSTGFGDVLSVILGCVLIVMGLAGITRISIPVVSSGMTRFSGVLRSAFSQFVSRKGVIAFAGMGMINGLLPCGLTYLALVASMSVQGLASAFIYMIVFGAGTLPVMLGLSSVVQRTLNRLNFDFRKAATLALIGVGILLLTRGLSSQDHSTDQVSADGISVCR